MSSVSSIRVQYLPVKTLAFGSVVAGYAAIGTPLVDPARIILIQNFTDAAIMVSYDGINDHYPVDAHSYIIWDYCSDSSTNVVGFYVSSGTQIYCKRLSGAPTLGSVYVSVVYGRDV